MKATGIALLVLVALTTFGCFNVGDVNIPEPPDVDIRVNDGGSGDSSAPSVFPDIGHRSPAGELGAENGVLFYAYDVLTYPGEARSVAVRVLSARTFEGLGGVTIDFTRTNRRTGATETIGTAVTDRTGMATLPVKPNVAGNYTFDARIAAVPANISDDVLNVTPTSLLLAARGVNSKFVAVSVDDVLVESGLGSLLAGDEARPMAGASDVLNRMADELDCTVIYVVSRPEEANGRLKRWLAEHDCPIGPVLAIDLGGSRRASDLSALRRAYPDVMMGIGPDIDSAREYLANGMTTFMIPKYEADPDEMRDLAEDIEDLPDSQQLNVLGSWKEIEMAVFYTMRFKPGVYARRLDKLADEIEDQQKRDRRREDRDD